MTILGTMGSGVHEGYTVSQCHHRCCCKFHFSVFCAFSPVACMHTDVSFSLKYTYILVKLLNLKVLKEKREFVCLNS